MGAGIGLAASGAAAPRAQAGAPAQAGIEPNTIKRRGVGLRGYDPDRASPGFTVFTPLTSKTVYLIDLQGQVIHTWDMPEMPNDYGFLTERGTLFYNGSFRNGKPAGLGVGGVAREVDWSGNVLWEVYQTDQTHDGRLLQNGNILLLCATELRDDIASRVQGGLVGSELQNGKISTSYLQELTTAGQVVWEWRAWEHLDPEVDIITAVQDPRTQWPWGNSIFELPDRNVLISFRNISTVAMIDRQSGDIYWKLGAPPLAGQHAPHILANGNILLFDNGPHRLDQTFPFSRVLEINPGSKAIIRQYADTPVSNFFSPRFGNAQRLPNGNTLICEAYFGRFFEVTPQGETVSEYVNPYFGGPPNPAAQDNQVFRAYRYTADEIAAAQAAT